MSVLSWIYPKAGKLEREKKQLQGQLAQSFMKIERTKSQVEQVARDVMLVMHKGRNSEKN